MKISALLATVMLLVSLFLVAGQASSAPATLLFEANVSASIPGRQGESDIWQDVDELTLRDNDQGRQIIPEKYRLVKADMAALDERLSQAPLEFSQAARRSQVILPLPLPDGSLGRFSIEESPIMAPELAADFPEIKTYRGFGLDDSTASIRLDRTPAGFHGQILSVNGTAYIDPYRLGDVTHYISYYKQDLKRSEAKVFEETGPERLTGKTITAQQNHSSGPILRTYRLAMAANGEYTQFHGGTVPDAMNAIAASVNRVTGIYEREASIRLELVAGNQNIIFTDPNTDPYDGQNDLNTNQTVIDNAIGSANYDIGHLFTVGGGGIAGLGVVCSKFGFKARGLTGSSQPVGDAFDVDFVAHEIGHQFGATHTFNASSNASGSCDPNNFEQTTAYEPGSGSTIMAYAGICPPQNLQNNSNDYFHTASFDQIMELVTQLDADASCGSKTNTGNNPPVVDAGADRNDVNVNTPFTLTGSANDPEGDPLTFAWEQFDQGAGWTLANVLPNTDIGLGPIFRSYSPTTSPSRTFPNPNEPALAAVGESLPTSNRTLTFRLIARDGKGGVSYDTMQVTVQGGIALNKVYLPTLIKEE